MSYWLAEPVLKQSNTLATALAKHLKFSCYQLDKGRQ